MWLQQQHKNINPHKLIKHSLYCVEAHLYWIAVVLYAYHEGDQKKVGLSLVGGYPVVPSYAALEMVHVDVGVALDEVLYADPGDVLCAVPVEVLCVSQGEVPCVSRGEVPCVSLGEVPCASLGEVPCVSLEEVPCVHLGEVPGVDPPCATLMEIPYAPGEVLYVPGEAPCDVLEEAPYFLPPYMALLCVDLMVSPYVIPLAVPYVDQGEVPYAAPGEAPYAAPGEVPCVGLGEIPCVAPGDVAPDLIFVAGPEMMQ